MLELLAPEHRVTLLTPAPRAGQPAAAPGKQPGPPLAPAQLAPRADLAVLQLVRLAAHRGDLGATPVLVDLIDDLALNFSRRAAMDRWWLRPALALEARLLARA